jgi:hypothetical protein
MVSSQISEDVAAEGRITGSRSLHRPVSRTNVFHNGYLITVGRQGRGWWARIDELSVETLLFPDRAAALAAGVAFVDGMTRSLWKSRLWERRIDRP